MVKTDGDFQDHPGDESYFEDREKTALDDSILREPISTVTTRRPLVLSAEDSVAKAVEVMREGRCGSVLITKDGTNESEVTGIFTERDIINRFFEIGAQMEKVTLEEIMTPNPIVLPQESSLAWVLNRMSVEGVRHVPIVDEKGWPLYMVSIRDIVDLLVESFSRTILTLPAEFGVRSHTHREGA